MFLSNPFLGRLSDQISRRPVLIASLFVNALAHLWFAFSDDIIQMFAARILAGLASGNTGVIQAIVAGRVASAERARYIALFGAAIGTGFVAGPALGGLLSGVGSGPLHQAPFLLAAGFSFLALALSNRIAESAAHWQMTPSAKQLLGVRLTSIMHGPLALFALAFFCLNLSFAQVEASFVLLLRDYLDFDARQTGWLFTYIGVCIFLVQGGLINTAVGRFGEVGKVGFGASLLVIGQILTVIMAVGSLVGNGYPLMQMLIVTTAVCFGFGFSDPALSAAASNAAGKITLGGALGMVQGFGGAWSGGGLGTGRPVIPYGWGALFIWLRGGDYLNSAYRCLLFAPAASVSLNQFWVRLLQCRQR